MDNKSLIGTSFASASMEFAARLQQTANDVAQDLLNKKRDIYDYSMYVTRFLAADTTIELFKAADDKEVGLTNINSRQLEDKNYFLVTGIQLLAATSESALDSEQAAKAFAKTAEFKPISNVIANGEFELKLGEKSLLPRISCEVFRKGADDGKPEGYYKLEAPKMLKPLTDITPWLFLPKSQENKVVIKVVLYGVRNN